MEHTAEQKSSQHWQAPFFTIWGGQAVSLLGSQLVQFALVWWLTQETGSATVLAMATLVAMLPQILLAPLAGALVDRWNRRVVLIIADGLIALAVLVMALLFWLEVIQIWHIYVLMFFRSAAGIFHWSAMQASTSLMVPKEHLSRIQGLNQMLNGAMNIGAAPLGALLLSVLPMQGILMIDVGTAAVAILPLFFYAIPQPKRSVSPDSPDGKSNVWQDMRAGLRYVWGWPGLMLVMVMATLINLLLTPASSLTPILVSKYFSGGAFELAWMEAAWGVGMIVGGLVLSAWGGFKRRVLTSLIGLVVLGAAMAAIGFIPVTGFWIAVGMWFLTGFANPIVNGPLFAVVQAVVAPDVQGRVFTLMISVASAMSPLGLIVAGPVADLIGVQSWFVIGGFVTLLLGVVALFIPAIMNIEQDRHTAEPDLAQSGAEPALGSVPVLEHTE